MECPSQPNCAALLKAWLECVGSPSESEPAARSSPARMVQGVLWNPVVYSDETPWIGSDAELRGAFEHLEYAVFRRYSNHLTRAERLRLENTIQNTIYKIEHYQQAMPEPSARQQAEDQLARLKEEIARHQEVFDRMRSQARRSEHKLAQLGSLTPEGFEEFVAELFESLGYQVEQVGGTDDRGIDLKLQRGDLRAVAQCKAHKKGLVGSPELQKFLGAVHFSKSHKGFFVTTTTFTLAAERYASDQPIELIDGARLVELVQQALGPGARKEPEPVWF